MDKDYFNDDKFKNTLDDYIEMIEERLYIEGVLKMGENWIDDVGNVLDEIYKRGIHLYDK